MILHQILAYWLDHTPDKTALIYGTQQQTYRQLNQRSEHLAAGLSTKFNIQKGERVGLLSTNCIEMVEVMFALSKLGAIAVPLNIRLTAKELEFIVSDCQLTTVFFRDSLKELENALQALVPIQNRVQFFGTPEENVVAYEELLQSGESVDFSPPDDLEEGDPLMLIYTSGTTGHPKGAILSHGNNIWNCINAIHILGMLQKDISITILPLFHIGGWGCFLLPTLFQGGTVIMQEVFDPIQIFQDVEKYQISIFMGVPTIFNELQLHPQFETADLSSVRIFASGGAPCPVSLIETYQNKGYTLTQGFGMSETSPVIFLMRPADSFKMKGSVGKPAICCDARIVDDDMNPLPPDTIGELVLRGNVICQGYWNRPEATAEANRGGWLHSGDLAYYDKDGFYYMVDRKKDMVLSGGENIYPAEVESVLFQHPAVAEAAVFGMPHPKWDEVPVAAIVPKPEKELTAEMLNDWCQDKLARYKQPKQYFFREDLPKTASGKTLKRELKEIYTS